MRERADVERQLPRCPNCSAELADEYCPRCGQRRIRPQDLSARRFLHEVVDEVTNFRAKFKTLHTLRRLLSAGVLTAEYLTGQRQPHLSPFKVYLVCAAIFFLSAPVAGFGLASMLDSDRSGTLSRLVSARAAERGLDLPLFEARFDVRVQSVYTITLGAAAILFALMLQLSRFLAKIDNSEFDAVFAFPNGQLQMFLGCGARGPTATAAAARGGTAPRTAPPPRPRRAGSSVR
jgi:hypothetical protein